jgi:hypothetical protein
VDEKIGVYRAHPLHAHAEPDVRRASAPAAAWSHLQNALSTHEEPYVHVVSLQSKSQMRTTATHRSIAPNERAPTATLRSTSGSDGGLT